jgi:hypothetical protein
MAHIIKIYITIEGLIFFKFFLHFFLISLPIRFGWNPVSRHRKVIISRIKPVIEKRIGERKMLGKDYKPYVIQDIVSPFFVYRLSFILFFFKGFACKSY